MSRPWFCWRSKPRSPSCPRGSAESVRKRAISVRQRLAEVPLLAISREEEHGGRSAEPLSQAHAENPTNAKLIFVVAVVLALAGCKNQARQPVVQASAPPASTVAAPAPSASVASADPVAASDAFRCPSADYAHSCSQYQTVRAAAEQIIVSSANLVCFRQSTNDSDFTGWFFVVAYLPPERTASGLSHSLFTVEVYKDGEGSPSLPPFINLLGGHAKGAGYYGHQSLPGTEETANITDGEVYFSYSYKAKNQDSMYYIFKLKRQTGEFKESFSDYSEHWTAPATGSCVQVKPFDLSR